MTPVESAIHELPLGTITVLGIPFDGNSSFEKGAAQAPAVIRESLHSQAGNLCAENGLDLGAWSGWSDLGDLDPGDPEASEQAFPRIEAALGALLAREARVVTLGGDHSITYPILRATSARYERLSVLQLDAHSDLYDELAGNRHSHACPFARIMEERRLERLVQVGIRTLTTHQREQAARFGVEIHELATAGVPAGLTFKGNVYLSIDMDVLDPAFAPGVSHPEPGGLSTRDLIGIIQNLRGRLVGADLVEFNPDRDPWGLTARVASKLVKELIARMQDDL